MNSGTWNFETVATFAVLALLTGCEQDPAGPCASSGPGAEGGSTGETEGAINPGTDTGGAVLTDTLTSNPWPPATPPMIMEASELDALAIEAPKPSPLLGIPGMEEPDETFAAAELLAALRQGDSPLETQLFDGVPLRFELRSHTDGLPCAQSNIHDNGDVEQALNTIEMMNFDVFNAESRARIGTLFISSDGFVAGQIDAGSASARIMARGGSDFSVTWQEEHPFSGPYMRAQPNAVRSAETVSKCNDGLDNDFDLPADRCDENCLSHVDFGGDRPYSAYSESVQAFAIMGEAPHCHRVSETWCGEMYSEGFEAAEILDQAYLSVGVETTFHTMELAHCYFFDSEDAANECQRTFPLECRSNVDTPLCCADESEPDCPPGAYSSDPNDPGTYPYAGLGGVTGWKYPGEWFQFDEAADIVGEDVHPVQMVGLRVRSIGFSDGTFGPCETSVGGAVGVAYSPFNDYNDFDALRNFGAMQYDDGLDEGLPGRVAAHEFGHLEGLQHAQDSASFMYWSAGPNGPILGLIDPDHTTANVWTTLMNFGLTEVVEIEDGPDADDEPDLIAWPTNEKIGQSLSPSKTKYPRPTGFAFQGCESNSDCRPLGRGGHCSPDKRCVIYLP